MRADAAIEMGKASSLYRRWALTLWMFVATTAILAGQTRAQISQTTRTYSENFDIMGTAGNLAPTGWFVGTDGSASTTTVAANSGAATSGNNFNYGNSGDRALGSLASGGVERETEFRAANNAGASILSFTINYTGEQWRHGASAVTNTLSANYSSDGSSFVAMGSSFNFVSPVNSGSGTALDGNVSGNFTTGRGGLYTPGSSVAAGGTIYLRWSDPDDTNADDGLAIDDFSITFNYAPLYWDLNGNSSGLGSNGTSGTWNTTANNWTESSTGSTGIKAWASVSKAIFSGTGGTVSVAAAVSTEDGLQFDADGYQLTDGGGSITLAPLGNTITVTNAAHTAKIAAPIAGISGLTKAGAGTLVLSSSNNSYSGNTTISLGALQVGDGGTSGVLGSGNVVNNSKLVFNRSDGYSVANAISGSGNLYQVGSGSTTLTASNAYTGTTNVTAGKLIVNGTLTSGGGAVTVGDGVNANTGVLMGTGSISRSVKIDKGGTLAPGDNGVGILKTNDQTWIGGGTLSIEIGDASDQLQSSAGSKYDQLQLNGSLDLTALTTGSRFKIDVTGATDGTIAHFDKSLNYDWLIVNRSGGVTIDPSLFDVYDHVSNDQSGADGAPGGSWSLFGNASGVILHYSAAPEPGTFGLVSLMMMSRLLKRPRRASRIAV